MNGDQVSVDVRVGDGEMWMWPVVARIWQTVDVERTLSDLGISGDSIARDDALGAKGVLVEDDDGVPVAILEPSTEGPLAESLARHGEGNAGQYAAPPGGFAEARRAGYTLGRAAPGPFGRSALARVPPGTSTMPFMVIVDRSPATIAE
jgi:hypothetical protein